MGVDGTSGRSSALDSSSSRPSSMRTFWSFRKALLLSRSSFSFLGRSLEFLEFLGVLGVLGVLEVDAAGDVVEGLFLVVLVLKITSSVC